MCEIFTLKVVWNVCCCKYVWNVVFFVYVCNVYRLYMIILFKVGGMFIVMSV